MAVAQTAGGDEPAASQKREARATPRTKVTQAKRKKATAPGRRAPGPAPKPRAKRGEQIPQATQVDVAAMATPTPAIGETPPAGEVKEAARPRTRRGKRGIRKKARKTAAPPGELTPGVTPAEVGPPISAEPTDTAAEPADARNKPIETPPAQPGTGHKARKRDPAPRRTAQAKPQPASAGRRPTKKPAPPELKTPAPPRKRAVTAAVSQAQPAEVHSETEVYAEAEGEPLEGSATREMLINVSAGDECRIAVLHEGRLEELFIERESAQSHVGNIYKARVTNVESSIQAVFVDFGLLKNGFLHISDVQPQYFPNHQGEKEEVGRKIPHHARPPIQKCFRRGQELIVQVIKEGVGTKGPTLTTYLSIPGRFLVMMPGMNRLGVSRKIEDEADRRKMREQLDELTLPAGMGFILRTAGLGRNKRELQRDLNYLLRLWKKVVERVKSLSAPAELYRESDLVTRTIRDVYTAHYRRVVVDDAETAQKVREFLQIAMPRSKTTVEFYTQREPLFHRFGIEQEIAQIGTRNVPLPSGGHLVIDSTEALVAIDVNSGRFRSPDDAEETAFQINLEAAAEIARQLRLRDLGGLIVCDFIDMRLDHHKREVERALRNALKKHKERAKTLRMSAFGLIEMTRQRQGPSLKRNLYFDCAHCKGTGQVKMPESVMLDVLRIVQLAVHHEHVQKISVVVASEVAFQILNGKRSVLSRIEAETGKEILIAGNPSFTSDQFEYKCEDSRGGIVALLPGQNLPRQPAVVASAPRGGRTPEAE